jgi:hypothetical protein
MVLKLASTPKENVANEAVAVPEAENPGPVFEIVEKGTPSPPPSLPIAPTAVMKLSAMSGKGEPKKISKSTIASKLRRNKDPGKHWLFLIASPLQTEKRKGFPL